MSNEHCPDQSGVQTELDNFLRSNSQLTYQLGAIIDYKDTKLKNLRQ